MNIDLTPLLKERFKPYPRKRGRYNSSELWAITSKNREGKPYLTPEQWLNPKQDDAEGLLRMWQGMIIHDHVQKLLPAETNEVKKEVPYKDMILVAKADNLPKDSDEVWEFKTSATEMDKSKPWADYQCRLYTSIFERPKGIIYQPVQSTEGLYLKQIGEVYRDDVWFKKQLDALYLFHLKLETLWEAQNLIK